MKSKIIIVILIWICLSACTVPPSEPEPEPDDVTIQVTYQNGDIDTIEATLFLNKITLCNEYQEVCLNHSFWCYQSQNIACYVRSYKILSVK